MKGTCLEQLEAFPGSESADELDERRDVRVVDALVDVDAHLVDAEHELAVEGLEEAILGENILR